MGKQKHDLGVRKRALNAKNNGERTNEHRTPDFAIGQPASEFYKANLYGPPEHVRQAAYEFRKAGQHTMAQRIMDGTVEVNEVGLLAGPPPEPGSGARKRSPEARARRGSHQDRGHRGG